MIKRTSDSEIAAAIITGKSDREIMRSMHVGHNRVRAVRARTKELHPAILETPLDTIKAIAKLELSQEETLTEFSVQMSEYTKNYEDAKSTGDQDAMGKWSLLRLKLLEHMIKISGLDQRREAPPPQEEVTQMSDEELVNRAAAIIRKLQEIS